MIKKLLPLFLLLVVAGGCTVKPRPPLFSLYGRHKLVVLPVQNNTQDPALAQSVQDGVEGGLVRLNAVPVAEDSAVSALLAKQRATNLALESDDTLRMKIVDSLKADTIMAGTVNTYTEDVREEEPQRLQTHYKPPAYKWGYNDTVAVFVNATVKILDANTGNVLWVRQARGDGVLRRWKDLAWPGENTAPPPEGWDRLKGRGKTGRGGQGTPGNTGSGTANATGGTAQGTPGAQTAAPVAGAPAGTPVNTGGGQTINIIVQNVNQQSQGQAQTQTQTQQQQQQQAQAAPAEKAPPKLLYMTDSNVARAREAAISYTVNQIVSDYYGVGGWTPGYVPPPAKK